MVDWEKCEFIHVLLSIFILYFIYLIARGFYIFILGSVTLKSRLRSYGQWAVVTGCTGGLGQEFSRQIAQLGINVILIDKCDKCVLEKMANDIEKECNVKTMCIVSDFRETNEENYNKIYSVTDTLDVGILINNAGYFHECPSLYHQLTNQLRDLVDINIYPPMMLTHHFIARKMQQKKTGLVVFMGSYSGVIPQTYFSAYSATKAYITFLVKSLAIEYKGHGIFVQGLCPSFMSTGMNSFCDYFMQPSFLCPSAKTYVQNALPTFGLTHFTTGYYPFEIAANLISMGPEWAKQVGSNLMMRMILSGSKRKH